MEVKEFIMECPMIIDERIVILIGNQSDINDIIINKYGHKNYNDNIIGKNKVFGLVSSSSKVNTHFVCVFLDNIKNCDGNVTDPYKTLIHELEHLNTRIRYELSLFDWRNHSDEAFVRWWTSFMVGMAGDALKCCSDLMKSNEIQDSKL